MSRYIHIAGCCLVVFGFFGGFEFAADMTGIESLNTLTKDQVACIIGATWILITK